MLQWQTYLRLSFTLHAHCRAVEGLGGLWGSQCLEQYQSFWLRKIESGEACASAHMVCLLPFSWPEEVTWPHLSSGGWREEARYLRSTLRSGAALQGWRGRLEEPGFGNTVRALALEMTPETSNGYSCRARVSNHRPAGSIQSTAMWCLKTSSWYFLMGRFCIKISFSLKKNKNSEAAATLGWHSQWWQSAVTGSSWPPDTALSLFSAL